MKLNGEQTQFIWMGSHQRLTKIRQDTLRFQGAELSPLGSVHDFGFIIDVRSQKSV